MAVTYEPRKDSTIRVNIGQRELADWVGKDVPQSMIKHWIELGRQRQDNEETVRSELAELRKMVQTLTSRVEELQDEVHRHVTLTSQLGHLIAVATSREHYDLENLRYRAEHSEGDLSAAEKRQLNAFRVKDFNFKKYLARLFPGVVSERLLSFKQEE